MQGKSLLKDNVKAFTSRYVPALLGRSSSNRPNRFYRLRKSSVDSLSPTASNTGQEKALRNEDFINRTFSKLKKCSTWIDFAQSPSFISLGTLPECLSKFKHYSSSCHTPDSSRRNNCYWYARIKYDCWMSSSSHGSFASRAEQLWSLPLKGATHQAMGYCTDSEKIKSKAW